MVGVPGKSKGCLTCRRRKIKAHAPQCDDKCDLNEPDCKRCTNTGRTCEGYARFPTFLINTPEGRRRRERLEEAKPRTSPPVSRSGFTASSSQQYALTPEDRSLIQQRNLSILPKRVDAGQLQDDQLIACFWANYMPLETSAQEPSAAPWLKEIIFTKDACPALRLSLKALALTRLGWINKDEALSKMGHTNYGLALKHVQRALWDPLSMWSDHTLAASHCLSIYELFEATDNSIKGWDSHVSGLGLLIRMRGPESYQSPIGQSILYGYSFASMIHCLTFRKASFLASREWKIKLFNDPIDAFHYRLFEFGFELAATMEETDSQGLQHGNLSIDRCVGYINVFLALDVRMDSWLSEFKNHCGTIYELDMSNTRSSALPDRYKGFVFKTFRHAIVMSTYWALKLILNHILNSIRAALLIRFPSIQPPTGTGTSAGKIIASLLGGNRKNHCLELATNIIRAMPYVLSDDMGLIGAQQSIFPLRVAMLVLKRYPGEELKWCEAAYAQFDRNKGLRYATEVAKVEGKYGEDRPSTITTGYEVSEEPDDEGHGAGIGIVENVGDE